MVPGEPKGGYLARSHSSRGAMRRLRPYRVGDRVLHRLGPAPSQCTVPGTAGSKDLLRFSSHDSTRNRNNPAGAFACKMFLCWTYVRFGESVLEECCFGARRAA